jgi:hypothetical protein
VSYPSLGINGQNKLHHHPTLQFFVAAAAETQ